MDSRNFLIWGSMLKKKNMLGSEELKEVRKWKDTPMGRRSLFIRSEQLMKKEAGKPFQIIFCNSHTRGLDSRTINNDYGQIWQVVITLLLRRLIIVFSRINNWRLLFLRNCWCINTSPWFIPRLSDMNQGGLFMMYDHRATYLRPRPKKIWISPIPRSMLGSAHYS